MKLGLAIAPENALPTAFVVFRDKLEVSMAKAAALGYDGVELALLEPAQADVPRLKRALREHGLALPAISTGQVFSEGRVWFTHPNQAIRQQAIDTVKGMIDVAAEFGALVNVGRVRGYIHEEETETTAQARLVDALATCADYAGPKGVGMVLEPVNRYEINYVNSVPDALQVLKALGRNNVGVMPDVFHMNIEDVSIPGSLEMAGPQVRYVHFADSNRWAPGQGHLDFLEIIGALHRIGYEGYVTVEMLPYPDPDTAARQAAAYLRPLL